MSTTTQKHERADLPRDLERAASAGILAGVLTEHTNATGDPGYRDAREALDTAGRGIPEPRAVTDRDAMELGVEPTSDTPPAGPPPLIAPTVGGEIKAARTIEHPYAPEQQGEPLYEALDDEGDEYEDEPETVGLEDLAAGTLPPDIASLLDEDDDDEDDETPVAATQGLDITDEELEYADELTKRLAAENKRLRKTAERSEREKLRAQRQEWLQKDSPHFAAVAPDVAASIAKSSTSRRDFLRRMKAKNDEIAPLVAAALARAGVSLAPAREEQRDERRQRQAEEWGAPVAGGGGAPVIDYGRDRRRAIARERNGLAGIVTDMVRSGDLRV